MKHRITWIFPRTFGMCFLASRAPGRVQKPCFYFFPCFLERSALPVCFSASFTYETQYSTPRAAFSWCIHASPCWKPGSLATWRLLFCKNKAPVSWRSTVFFEKIDSGRKQTFSDESDSGRTNRKLQGTKKKSPLLKPCMQKTGPSVVMSTS